MERSEMTTNKEQINRNRPENNTDIRLKNKDIKKDIIYIYIYIYIISMLEVEKRAC